MIEAGCRLTHSPNDVFGFLADLRNHWRLEDSFVVLDALDVGQGGGSSGGRVRIKGPLGLSRVARTTVVSADPPGMTEPGRLSGRAEVGPVTVGRVGWEIAPLGSGGAGVRLWATVERASLLDRLLLSAGGRWWLARIFRKAVANLDRVLEDDRTDGRSL